MDPEPTTPTPPPAPEVHPLEAANPFEKREERNRRIRIALFGLGTVLILALLVWVFYLWTRAGILILEPQKDFTVTLNGVQARLQQEGDGVFIRTSPGVYRLELTKASYEPFEADIKVQRGQIVRIRPIFSVLPKTTQQANSSVDYVRPSSDQKAVFYLGNNRQTIYRVEIAKQIQIPITVDTLQNVQDIQWSREPDLALVVQSDGTYLQEIPRFDFTTQLKVKIAGPEVASPIWDPNDSNRIAFAYSPGTGEHSLVFSDKRITTLSRMADISSIPNPKLAWSPDSDYVLLVSRSANFDQRNLWVYHTVDGTLKQLTTSGNILDASFSPDSGTILYEQLVGNVSKLHSIHPDGSSDHDLNIEGSVSQAAWHDGSSFYLPDAPHNTLKLYTTTGSAATSIPFSFPNTAVQGMYYYPDTHTLIFYTSTSIYLADLSK